MRSVATVKSVLKRMVIMKTEVLRRRKVHDAGPHMRVRSDAYQVVLCPIKRWQSTSFHFKYCLRK